METSRIVAEIDAEISRLQQARALLSGTTATATAAPVKGRRGRPKGSKNATTATAPAEKKTATKRSLSPQGRKAIADAMRKRWAERKKQEA